MDMQDIISQSLTSVTGTDAGNFEDATVSTSVLSGVTSGVVGTIPQSLRNDVNLISDFRLGSLLAHHNKISGPLGTVLDSALGLVLGNRHSDRKYNDVNFNNFSVEKRFIPIILKTTQSIVVDTNTKVSQPLTVVFDSTPETISISKNASWTAKQFLGRPEPVQVFSDSSPKTFSLKGKFFSKSLEDMRIKLDLSEALFSLVTPSKNHFMPSTVQVMIGEWKTFLCIVNSVNVTYQGPWWIPSDNESVMTTTASNTETNKTGYIGTSVQMLSHAPYMFEADFSFTVVSPQNKVSYAEDIASMTTNYVIDSSKTGRTYSLANTNVTVGDGTSVSSEADQERTYIKTTSNPMAYYGKEVDGTDVQVTVQEYLQGVRTASEQNEDRLRQGALLGVLSGGISNIAKKQLGKLLGK